MIISCYPGVGKSTIASKRIDIIDLDSRLFNDDSVISVDFFKRYISVAKYLSKQGKIVLVSSHSDVRKQLLDSHDEKIAEIFPSEKLEDEWIERLRVRWETSGNKSDYHAYWRSKINYVEDVKDMKNDFNKEKSCIWFRQSELCDMDYDLEEVIEGLTYECQ